MVVKISRKKIFGFLLALCPILRLYNFPGLNVNLALIIVLLIFLYVFMHEFKRRFSFLKKSKTTVLLPIVCMGIYAFVSSFIASNHISSLMSTFGDIFVFFGELLLIVFIFYDNDLREYHNHYLAKIAIVASYVIFVQFFFYYLFGMTLSEGTALLPFQDFLIESAKPYMEKSSVMDGLFRPSAFFLEPSHMGRYCILGLIVYLVEEEKLFTKNKIIISLGIIMTTSGVGLLALLAVWLLWIFFGNDVVNKKILTRILVIFIALILVVVIAYFTVPFFASTVNRMFNSGDGYNAISGRLGTSYLFTQLEGLDSIFGMGFKNYPTYGALNTLYYMTGIIKLLYCQGGVGFLILGGCILYMFFEAKKRMDKLQIMVMLIAIVYIVATDWFVPLTMLTYFPFLYKKRQ